MSQASSNGNSIARFDIRDHLDKLTETKTKNKYICPVCDGNDLSIRPKDGAYSCLSTGCDSKSIREAIAPFKPKSTASKAPAKKKSHREREKDAAIGVSMVESKIDELIWMIDAGSTTPRLAALTLSVWCKEHSHNGFNADQLLKERLKIVNAARNGEEPDDENKPRMLREYELIKRKFGDRFRYNTFLKQPELDGELFQLARSKAELTISHGLRVRSGRDDLADIIDKLARENSHNPLIEYLDKVSAQHGETDILEGFSARYFGADDPIYQTVLIKFLISAVARAYQPGCKCDTALLLQGEQGANKSTFFRVLASDAWFDDTYGTAKNDDDDRLKLHMKWIIEWPELENLFKKKDISQVKAMMSCQTDFIRPAYARGHEVLQRQSIFCGTTNQDDFLTDPTGSRRFWVIPVHKTIDTPTLREERDRVWAAAVMRYKRGENWWLNPEEEKLMQVKREEFQSSDPWDVEIEDFLEGKDTITVWDILETRFDIERKHRDRKAQIRVSSCLKRLKWRQQPGKDYYKGVRSVVWKTPKVLL